MSTQKQQSLTIAVDEERSVSGIFQEPAEPRACYVVAHGAGAGMTHRFLAALADGLAERGVATLRFQFPYMERGSKRTDPPAVAHSAVRAAVAEAGRLAPRLPLFAGGKSFGGRMTSQAQAVAPLAGVSGLVFLGFPFHPPGRPSEERAQHLYDVRIPMLFLQGTRDDFGELPLVQKITGELGALASLELIPDADHSFHVPARTGRKDAEVLSDILDTTVAWTAKIRP
jgi:uncharacterized protein